MTVGGINRMNRWPAVTTERPSRMSRTTGILHTA